MNAHRSYGLPSRAVSPWQRLAGAGNMAVSLTPHPGVRTYGRFGVMFPRLLTGIHKQHLNHRALRSVGRGALADLEHVGRRTGTDYHTVVRAFRTADAVVIGLNFGRESDWVRNVMAAGRCRVRLGDQVMELTEPRIVPIGQG